MCKIPTVYVSFHEAALCMHSLMCLLRVARFRFLVPIRLAFENVTEVRKGLRKWLRKCGLYTYFFDNALYFGMISLLLHDVSGGIGTGRVNFEQWLRLIMAAGLYTKFELLRCKFMH